MKTKQMVSNISYNTEEHLKSVLDRWLQSKDIFYYMYIKHKAEEEELYDHIHFIVYPNCVINTDNLFTELIETDIDNELPLGCTRKWKKVQEDKDLDWLLYVLHEPIYILSKCDGLKKFNYNPCDVVSPDERTKQDIIFRAYHETDFFHDKQIRNIIMDKSKSIADLFNSGYIPIKQACNYHHYIQLLQNK